MFGPRKTEPRAHGKVVPARHLRCPRRRHSRAKVVKVNVELFIRDQALGLLGPDRSIERLDVGDAASRGGLR